MDVRVMRVMDSLLCVCVCVVAFLCAKFLICSALFAMGFTFSLCDRSDVSFSGNCITSTSASSPEIIPPITLFNWQILAKCESTTTNTIKFNKQRIITVRQFGPLPAFAVDQMVKFSNYLPCRARLSIQCFSLDSFFARSIVASPFAIQSRKNRKYRHHIQLKL